MAAPPHTPRIPKRVATCKVSDKAAAVSAPASVLSAASLFQDIPASHLLLIEQESTVAEVLAGHVFFRPGEIGDRLYLLEKGAVRTFRSSGEKKLIIADLKPPAVFGEMGCVGRCIYHCFAQASAPSRVRSLSRAQIDTLLSQFPSFTRRLLDLVSDRFVHVLVDLDETSFHQLIPRLARLLLASAEADSIRGMTHREIAERLRVYRESATSALGELRKAGILATDRKQIRIIDRRRLERAARE
jgi:CRP/FNR family transcriptional regulator